MTVKQVILYLGYFAAAFAVFAVLRFPHQAAARKVSDISGRLFPGVMLEMDRLDPGFSTKLCAIESRLYLGSARAIPLETLCFSLFPGVFYPEKQIRVSASLAGGKVNGQISGISLDRDQYDMLAMILTGLQVRDVSTRVQGTPVTLSFDLAGSYRFHREPDHTAGSGELVLNRLICHLQNETPAAHDFDTFEFDRVNIDWSRDNDEITVTRLSGSGRFMTVELEGILTMAGGLTAGPDDWHIDLTGRLSPQAAYVSRFAAILSMETLFRAGQEKGIPIRIAGPVTDVEVIL